jgi:hypothetical protein
MSLKTAKLKASAQPMASSTGTENAILQEEIESLQRQLAESESCAATLQTTIEETWDTPAFTDLDYKHIVAAMNQQHSRDQSQDQDCKDRSLTALSEKERRSLKQPDPSLLSDSKDPTYTS